MLSSGGLINSMANPAGFDIEVAYASPDRQLIVTLAVNPGTNAREAVALSGLPSQFSEIDPVNCAVGVFGRQVDDHYVLRPGDRLEIYRPLRMDPREARRRLAARGQTMGRNGRKSG